MAIHLLYVKEGRDRCSASLAISSLIICIILRYLAVDQKPVSGREQGIATQDGFFSQSHKEEEEP
jgi:hypothetical protein